MKIQVKKEITGRKSVTYTKKEALYLLKCDHCGKIFDMKKYCNDKMNPGEMKGTFDKCAEDMGNMFKATVCSLKCAHEIFIGGWKKIKEYKPYAKIRAKLVRIEIGLTSLIIDEQEAISNWENEKERSPFVINKILPFPNIEQE